MINTFIITDNFQSFQEMCGILLSTSFGVEMGLVIGPAGRGKSTAAERVVTMRGDVSYVCYDDLMTHIGLVREICFVLSGIRPRGTEQCRDVIMSELARQRRIILVDEADKMSSKHLNTLRTFIHDKCRVPVILIGEEALQEKVSRERRLLSRISHSIHFDPIKNEDVVYFYRQSMGVDVSDKQAVILAKASKGDFRGMINQALQVEKIMRASDLDELTDAVIREVVGNVNGGQS